MKPHDQIFPLFAVNLDGSINRFLGTASFVLPGPVLLTAEHTIRGWDGKFGIIHLDDLTRLYPAVVVARDKLTDLAALSVEGYSPPKPFTLALEQDIRTNITVVSLEYGTTIEGAESSFVAPAVRIGNITRTLDLTSMYGPAGDMALELSFPALRGASGAPVLDNTTYQLWGVIIANVSYHLLPAQIETIVDPSGKINEKTEYLLPQGIAVNVRHVRKLLGVVDSK